MDCVIVPWAVDIPKCIEGNQVSELVRKAVNRFRRGDGKPDEEGT